VILTDSKTTLQEFTQEFFRRLPQYDTSQIGCATHMPVFRCALRFEGYEFGACASSKFDAEIEAASKAIEFLLKNDRKRISLLLAKRLSAGMRRSKGLAVSFRYLAGTLNPLRKAVGASCRDEAMVRCLTLRADASRFIRHQVATGEDFSFCGSYLAWVFDLENSVTDRKTYATFRGQIVALVREIRERLFPRTRDIISTTGYYDAVQALLYAEFRHGGFEAARKCFARVSVPRTTTVRVQCFKLLRRM
jgi:hypothetical protein